MIRPNAGAITANEDEAERESAQRRQKANQEELADCQLHVRASQHIGSSLGDRTALHDLLERHSHRARRVPAARVGHCEHFFAGREAPHALDDFFRALLAIVPRNQHDQDAQHQGQQRDSNLPCTGISENSDPRRSSSSRMRSLRN